MLEKQNRGQGFSVTQGTATTVVATTGSVVGLVYITDINVSSAGTTGTWSVVANPTPTAGTATLWQGSGNANIQISQHLAGNPNGTVSLTANTSGTNTAYANLAGYYIKVG